MLFNINEVIGVKLTEVGIQYLRQRHERMQQEYPNIERSEFTPPVPDERGFVRMQMWVMMQDFGEHLGMARDNPIETTIDIPIEKGVMDLVDETSTVALEKDLHQ